MISVCMATYNGANFIEEQVESILSQLGANDELIIVDDCSQDNTVELINALSDERIQLYENVTNSRHVITFERAVRNSSGELILLADQDDLWREGRLNYIRHAFEVTGKSVLVGRFREFSNADELKNDESIELDRQSLFEPKSVYLELMKKLVTGKPAYFGCCMAFKKEALVYLMPFDRSGLGHDQWIAFSALVKKDILHTDEVVTYRRIHDRNLTSNKRPLLAKLKTKLHWCSVFVSLIFREKMKQ